MPVSTSVYWMDLATCSRANSLSLPHKLLFCPPRLQANQVFSIQLTFSNAL
jgi:hypothetical protein